MKRFETTLSVVNCLVGEYFLSPSFHEVVSSLNDCLNKDIFERKVVAKYPFNLQSTMNGIVNLIF